MNKVLVDMGNCKLDANDLVCYRDPDGGIYSAGFNVKSIMMKAGISPIITMNTDDASCINAGLGLGEKNKVSDLFDNLVIPNWALAYDTKNTNMNNMGIRLMGGEKGTTAHKNGTEDDDDDVVDDDLHDRLLDLVKEHDIRKSKTVGIKKRLTRKAKNVKNKTRKMK